MSRGSTESRTGHPTNNNALTRNAFFKNFPTSTCAKDIGHSAVVNKIMSQFFIHNSRDNQTCSAHFLLVRSQLSNSTDGEMILRNPSLPSLLMALTAALKSQTLLQYASWRSTDVPFSKIDAICESVLFPVGTCSLDPCQGFRPLVKHCSVTSEVINKTIDGGTECPIGRRSTTTPHLCRFGRQLRKFVLSCQVGNRTGDIQYSKASSARGLGNILVGMQSANDSVVLE
jgi:hypothetical protein